MDRSTGLGVWPPLQPLSRPEHEGWSGKCLPLLTAGLPGGQASKSCLLRTDVPVTQETVRAGSSEPGLGRDRHTWVLRCHGATLPAVPSPPSGS